MRLSYWTLGMPTWDVAEFARAATAHGYDGVDLGGEKRDGTRRNGYEIGPDASDEEVLHLRTSFADNRVAVASLLCYNPPVFSDGVADWGRFDDEMARQAKLAARIGAPTIRFVVDAPPEARDWPRFLDRVWEGVSRGLDGVQGVGAVAENHPGNATAEQLLLAARRHADPRIGVEYSPDHALVMQEDVLGLVDRFAPQIHQVCIGDRRVVEHDLAAFDGRYWTVRYESCRIGDGVVPIAAVIGRLVALGFDGYISLKWERAPHFGQHLPPGETILPEFPRFMRSLPALAEAPVAD